MDGFSYGMDSSGDASPGPEPGSERLRAILSAILAGSLPSAPFPSEADVRLALQEAGLAEAADTLLRLMWTFRASALRPTADTCLLHPPTSHDERLLLEVIALHQHKRQVEAMILLRSALPPDAAIDARDCIDELARTLTSQGCWLKPSRVPAMRQTVMVA